MVALKRTDTQDFVLDAAQHMHAVEQDSSGIRSSWEHCLMPLLCPAPFGTWPDGSYAWMVDDAFTQKTQHMPEITAADNLNNELLVEFGEHLSHVMMQIEGQAPAALWIFRTTAPPELKNCSDGSGVHANNLLGKHSHVVALNTISRDIARRRGWEAPASSYEEKTV
ncbi:hypothetical protein WJX84_006891 [Apatococcus fuscideae]|uniref:Uncharacterized protein n=1 Tax=Apatococcus fuscideae TaxID=2026836 RepID=A0AAW1SJC7_9CHLO